MRPRVGLLLVASMGLVIGLSALPQRPRSPAVRHARATGGSSDFARFISLVEPGSSARAI